MNEDAIRQAVLHVQLALEMADRIVAAAPVGYADFGSNPRRHHTEKRRYTLKDARHEARYAAKQLRLAWDLLDPMLPRS